MLDHPPQEQPQAREQSPGDFATITPPTDRHWFVDVGGYCLACNLPESNGRHVPRVA